METRGRIVALGVRPAHGRFVDREEASARPGGGLEGDLAAERGGHRGVTLLSRERWADVVADMGRDLPWQTRRANVLVEGLDLLSLVGHGVQLGEVVLEVRGETVPCATMEREAAGLMAALAPDGRGGVYGRVHTGGTIRTGDKILDLGPWKA